MPAKNVCNAGILIGGIALAAIAGACSGGAAMLPALGGLLTFLSGMAGSQSQGWLKESADSLPPHPDELFRNHHLRSLITQAAAQEITSRPPRSTLRCSKGKRSASH